MSPSSKLIEGDFSEQRERSEAFSFFRVKELRELKEMTLNNSFVDMSSSTEDFDSSSQFEFVEEENLSQSSEPK